MEFESFEEYLDFVNKLHLEGAIACLQELRINGSADLARLEQQIEKEWRKASNALADHLHKELKTAGYTYALFEKATKETQQEEGASQ